MNLNTQLDPIRLIIFAGFFYELLFFYYLERLRRKIKQIEEEELIKILKKKYRD